MANIDRILQLASQRRALQEAADERRLKACLQVDADRADRIARQVIATASLRALGAAVRHGMKAERPHDDKAALCPHPSDAGLRPLWTNTPRPNQRRVPRGQHPHRIK